MNDYKVYIHIFPNQKVYIGVTRQKPEYRWRNGKKYNNNEYMTNAIQKYGWGNIEHKILYDNLSKEEAESKEKELILKYKSNIREFGYNILEGGNISNGMTEKGKQQMIDKNKGKHRSPNTEFKKGHKPWTTGKKMSNEFKQKLSESHLGQIAWNRKKIICLENNVTYSSIKEASQKLNINETGISRVCSGIMKQTGGFHFKYLKNNKLMTNIKEIN